MLNLAGDAPLGLPAFDLAVLGVLYDLGLTADAPHRNTAQVLRQLHADGLCSVDDGYRILQRLAAPWSMPLPLVEPHGNFGAMFEEPAQPRFNEVRLSNAGAMAVEAPRGELPLLPIGLINGDLPLLLGLDFSLWPFDEPADQPDSARLHLRPGFEPTRLVAALAELSVTPSERRLSTTIGAPWLGRFEPRNLVWDELYRSGSQTVQLTPLQTGEDWTPEPAEVVLDLGAPLLELLQGWVGSTRDRAPGPDVLERLVRRGDGEPMIR